MHGARSSLPIVDTVPDRVELCMRLLNHYPCYGQVYRPLPTVVKCRKCGSETGGVLHIRADTLPPWVVFGFPDVPSTAGPRLSVTVAPLVTIALPDHPIRDALTWLRHRARRFCGISAQEP